MNIDDLTLGEIKQIRQADCLSSRQHPFDVGANYFIRTVTHYLTGRLIKVFEAELVLEDAAWIADTGRYHEFLNSLQPDECEPYPPGELVIGRGAIIDAVKISKLPRDVK